jgi:hypothetical protein
MAIKNIDGDVKVEFTEPSQRQTLDSGESAKTLFGKISKWLRDLKAVAFSGSYNDLSNKPTIPTVNNGTLTIQQNGTTKATFTANQVDNVTADLTDTTYSAGDTMTLDNTTFNIGKRWTAVSKGRTWSRLFYSQRNYASIGSSGILSISAARDGAVIQATFLIISGAAPLDKSVEIIEIASNNYFNVNQSTIRVRAVTGGAGYYFFEVYDTANNIAVGTEQSWNCRYIPLLESELRPYTSFTDGTTIPTSWVAVNDFTTDIGSNAVAIKNITRSGNTFTATRQDGSTFTFSGVDFGTTAGTACEGNDSRVVNALQTISVNGVNQPAVNNNVNIDTGDAYGIDMYDDTLSIDITARGDNLEDWVIYGNNEVSKNLLDLSGLSNTTTRGVTFTVDAASGTITAVRTGTQTNIAYYIIPVPDTIYGDVYLSGCADGGSTITTYDVYPYDNTTGARPTNWSGSTQAASSVSSSDYVQVKFIQGHNNTIAIRIRPEANFTSLVFKPMIRAANTTPEFEPYYSGVGQLNSAGTGYELPIITKQTGKSDITTYIYLGATPLMEGQSLRKAQATTKDIPTYNGECTIDTTYPNKPRMEIIPTDSAINIIEKLRRIDVSNGSGSTIRTIYAPDAKNGLRLQTLNTRTNIEVACGQASNANGKVVFTDSKIYGGIGNPTSASVNHFMFNDDCVGDSIGKLSSGAPLTGSEFDLNYETINLNGSTINIDDNMSIGFETIDDYTVNTIKSPYIAISTDGISLSPKTTNQSDLLISRLPSGSGSELVINSNGVVYKSSSSREIKHDIQYIENAENYHDALMRIKPATYVYNNDQSEAAKLGMIAEDIADVMPIAALTGENGKVENYDTRAIIAMLVMEVQRLNDEIKRLRGDSNAD